MSPWTCAQPSRAFARVTGQGTGQVLMFLVRPPAFSMPLSGAEGSGHLPAWPEGGALSLWVGWVGFGLSAPSEAWLPPH